MKLGRKLRPASATPVGLTDKAAARPLESSHLNLTGSGVRFPVGFPTELSYAATGDPPLKHSARCDVGQISSTSPPGRVLNSAAASKERRHRPGGFAAHSVQNLSAVG